MSITGSLHINYQEWIDHYLSNYLSLNCLGFFCFDDLEVFS